jgi:hypothetical protein
MYSITTDTAGCHAQVSNRKLPGVQVLARAGTIGGYIGGAVGFCIACRLVSKSQAACLSIQIHLPNTNEQMQVCWK